MPKSTKQGAKGQKIGRNKRRPGHALQSFRITANRAARIARALRDRKPKAYNVPRGTARSKRRAHLRQVVAA